MSFKFKVGDTIYHCDKWSDDTYNLGIATIEEMIPFGKSPTTTKYKCLLKPINYERPDGSDIWEKIDLNNPYPYSDDPIDCVKSAFESYCCSQLSYLSTISNGPSLTSLPTYIRHFIRFEELTALAFKITTNLRKRQLNSESDSDSDSDSHSDESDTTSHVSPFSPKKE